MGTGVPRTGLHAVSAARLQLQGGELTMANAKAARWGAEVQAMYKVKGSISDQIPQARHM